MDLGNTIRLDRESDLSCAMWKAIIKASHKDAAFKLWANYFGSMYWGIRNRRTTIF